MCRFYFRNTNEALEFGRKHKGDTEEIKTLGFALLENEKLRERAKNKNPQSQEYLNHICNCQFIKEALSVMTGEKL